MATRRATKRSMTNPAGQGLAELAVFGSLVIMLLGVMISYGLNYNYNQQAQMAAFRKALQMAGTPVEPNSDGCKKNGVYDPRGPDCQKRRSGSYSLVQDRHIPSPGTMFGVGAMTPISASGNVLRSHRLHENPRDGNENALRHTRMRVQDQEFDCASGKLVDAADPNATLGCTTEGFRDVHGVTGLKMTDDKKWLNDRKKLGTIDKYEELYGGSNICLREDACGSSCVRIQKGPKGDPLLDRNGAPVPCGQDERNCLDDLVCTLRIIDPCMGQMLSYEGCVRLRRLALNIAPDGLPVLNDPKTGQPPANRVAVQGLCERECKRGRALADRFNKLPPATPPKPRPGFGLHFPPPPNKPEEPTCEAICRQPLSDLPWYAKADGEQKLNELFQMSRQLGLQPSEGKHAVATNELGQQETPTNITTTTKLDVVETTKRDVSFIAYDSSKTPTRKEWKGETTKAVDTASVNSQSRKPTIWETAK